MVILTWCFASSCLRHCLYPTNSLLGMFGRLIAMMAFISPGFASAASFDCRNAHAVLEKAICADADISRLDSLLQESYISVLRVIPDAEEFKEEQRQWLKTRSRCGSDKTYDVIAEIKRTCKDCPIPKDTRRFETTECLRDVYRTRLGEMEAILVASAPAKKSSEKADRVPGMWLMRTMATSSNPLYHLNVQGNVGETAQIAQDDYYYLDYSASGMRLKGFFTGNALPVSATAFDNRRVYPTKLVDRTTGAEIRFERIDPLNMMKQADGSRVSKLKDGTLLREREYPVLASKRCERASHAVERIQSNGAIIWSKVYLIDTYPDMMGRCFRGGSPADPDYDSNNSAYYFDDGSNDLSKASESYQLKDGSILIGMNRHLLRVRLEDGMPGRPIPGLAAVDSGAVMAFKKSLAQSTENAFEASRKYQEYQSCVAYYQTRKQKPLLCGRELPKPVVDPQTDQDYPSYQKQIKQHFLERHSEAP